MPQGIYRILNTLNNKCYVGSSVDILDRWAHHKMDLIGNRHANGRLQNAWNKYGPEVWKWEILQECEQEKLDLLEAFWMGRLDSNQNGYNIAVILIEDSTVKRKHSPETIERMKKPHNISEAGLKKMSEASKGKIITEAQKDAVRKANTGLKRSEEHRRILSETHKGKPKSEEHRRKLIEARNRPEVKETIRNKLIGQTRTPEFKERMRELNVGKKLSERQIELLRLANTGRPLSEEHKRKISAAGKGKKRSEETRRRISEAIKRSWERLTPEQREARLNGSKKPED